MQTLDTVSGHIGCDFYQSSTHHGKCGPNGGTQSQADKGKGFLVGEILVTSCVSNDDCGLSSLNCIGGFCTTLCSSGSNYCNNDTACVTTTDNSVMACHIR